MASDNVSPIGPGTTLTVTEIFHSIQGESSWAGYPCIFVRLTGCPLRCTYCDTTYAYDGGTPMTIDEILARCNEWVCPLVEITGGEPLMQPACADLAAALLEQGYRVLVETSGALPIHGLPAGVIRILDLKCPGSGSCEENFWANIDVLTRDDEVKFVIGDRADYEWSRDTVARYDLVKRCAHVLFSPVHGVMPPATLAEWILADGLRVRFQLALHKHIWPSDRRGV